MRTLLLAMSCFIALPLAASDQLERLNEVVSKLYQEGDLNATLERAHELLEMAKDRDNAYYIVRSYLMLGFTYKRTKNYSKAVLSYLEGARHAENSSTTEVGEDLISIYKNLALIMGDYKHFNLAHKFNAKGLEVAVRTGNVKQVISLLNNDGYKYFEEQKYDSAINVFNRILNSYSIDLRKKLVLKNDLGLVYWNQGNPDVAIATFRSILAQRESIQDTGFIARVLHNLGLALIDVQEYEEAMKCFHEAEQVNLQKAQPNYLFGNYKGIGISLFRQGDFDSAIEYFLKAESLFNESHVDPDHLTIFKLISDLYIANNQSVLAHEYERKYTMHLEAYIARQKEIAELDKKYNIELVTQRYFDLLAAEERHQRTIRMAQWEIGGVAAVFLLIIGIYLYRYHRKRYEIKKAIKQIEDNSPV